MNKLNENLKENLFHFVIKGGYNTSYINSLLTSLFYRKNEYINELLNIEPINPAGYYLQEIIKKKFVEPISKHYSINSDVINEIRNYLIINGYLNDLNIFDSIKSNSLDNLYDFISDFLNGEKMVFEIIKIKDGQVIEKNKYYKKNLIRIDITTHNTSIRKEFIKWIDTSLLNNNNDLYTYELKNIPTYICLYFNRLENNSNIDIMKQIKFFKNCNSQQSCIKYKIHGIVCKNNNSFYSVFYNNNKWIMFTENKIPSFEYISLNDYDIIDKIKLEVIFVIYTI